MTTAEQVKFYDTAINENIYCHQNMTQSHKILNFQTSKAVMYMKFSSSSRQHKLNLASQKYSLFPPLFSILYLSG